jgi:hypothetical protein
MVIVKLQGGLGNQLFQYAAARAVAKDERLILDTYFLNNNTKSTDTFTTRNYELAAFKKLRAKNATHTFSNMLNKKTGIYKYLNKVVFKYLQYIGHFTESEFLDFSKIKAKNLYLDGYFQDENYFKQIRGQLLADLTFPVVNKNNQAIEQQIRGAANPVSIHVRRGDFLKPALLVFNGLLPISHYQEAIAIIESRTVNPHYFIFSDDPEWCKSSFKFLGNNATIASGHSVGDWEDMALMRLCRHNIVANSSYSWWGAWLNTNPGKIVIAPQKWFYDMETNIIPSAWIKL